MYNKTRVGKVFVLKHFYPTQEYEYEPDDEFMCIDGSLDYNLIKVKPHFINGVDKDSMLYEQEFYMKLLHFKDMK